MEILEVSTGSFHKIDILPVQKSDYKSLPKKRYFFDWSKEKEEEVYKLVLEGQQDILGLVSIERITAEWRIHIRLLCVSVENKGLNKKFDGIVGNLIAFIAKIALREYGAMACVSLRPKSSIAQHYTTKYKMNITGMTLSLEVPEIIDLINSYDHD